MREKKRAAKTSQKYLDNFIRHPHLLVGKTIQHKCWDEDHTEAVWYAGTVVAIHKTNNNPLKTEYSVQYVDGEEDEEWHFDLLQDLKRLDLIICED